VAETNTPTATVSATREAIQQAFVALLFQRRYGALRVGEIIALAGIGRSTFYNHFRSKDEVLLSAIEPILTALADAATSRTELHALTLILEHVWEQRATGRLVFTPALLPRLQRKLAAMIEERLAPKEAAPAVLIGAGLAARQLAMVQLWVTGGAPASAEALAKALLRP
jgi:AcrR family transcriptional regulator